MLLFDGMNGTFRSIKLRPSKDDCHVCGKSPSITKPVDYVQFCGSSATDKARKLSVLDPVDRISCSDYHQIKQTSLPHLLLDVREELQYEICALENSISNFLFSF